MLKHYKILHYCFLIFLVSQSSTTAQFIRQDDFQYKNDYWYWRADGNQSIPSIENGLLHLKLQDAGSDQYCNTEIYDPTEPYQPGTQVRVRLKCSNIHHGSRGWGFWDGDLDLPSLFFDFDVAWVMQQGSDNPDNAYNWFHFGVDGNLLTNRHILNLQNLVDETEWHTYKIIWDTNNVAFYTDDGLLYQIYDDLPDEAMRMDMWIDNRVINIDNPLTFWNNNVETSEMIVDFVEISGVRGPSILRSTHDNIILWESPNTFPNGEKKSLWQQYSFNTNSTGEALIYLTGSAETYGTIMDDDNLKIVVDNNDYGWDTPNSLNGNELNGKGKSIVLPVMLNAGNHNLDIYSDITPFLRDVLVVYSENSKIICSNNYNETASGTDSLWKTVEFNTEDSTSLTIMVSGTGYENDGIRFELDNKDYGWQGENCIDGNVLKGVPATIVINEILEDGSHSLKIFNKGTPQLYSLAVYGKSTVNDVKDGETSSELIFLKANPNPFNNSTNIYYKTSNSSHNIVTIVNNLGQKLATLVNNYQGKGEYSVIWNAIDQTSGIYFCILESDNYFKVEKLLLLK
jgi:hypothetical protein